MNIATINPVWWTLVFGGLGAILWIIDRARRFHAALIAIAAFLLVVGYPPWTGTLATFVASPSGVVKLLAAVAVSGVLYFFMGVHRPKTKMKDGKAAPARKTRNHYHRIMTMLTALAFGTTLGMAIMVRSLLGKAVKQGPATVKAALHQATIKVNNGQAAAAVSAPHRQMIWLVAGAIILGLIVAMVQVERRVHNRMKPKKEGGFVRKMLGGGKSGGKGGQRALGGGFDG
jgi:hypothetical protein